MASAEFKSYQTSFDPNTSSIQQMMLSQNLFNTLNPEQRLRFALDTIQIQNMNKTNLPTQQPVTSEMSVANLLVDNTCQWPECHKRHLQFSNFERFSQFHLMQDHLLDETSHNQVIKQMHLVKTIEAEFSKQKNLLNSMLIHLNNQMVKQKSGELNDNSSNPIFLAAILAQKQFQLLNEQKPFIDNKQQKPFIDNKQQKPFIDNKQQKIAILDNNLPPILQQQQPAVAVNNVFNNNKENLTGAKQTNKGGYTLQNKVYSSKQQEKHAFELSNGKTRRSMA
jgi:hypothetical protein